MAATRPSGRSTAPGWAMVLGTSVGNVFLVLFSILFAVLSVLTAWIPPRGYAWFFCSRLWSWSVLLSSGVLVRRRFECRLDLRKRYVFMSNHESLYDIPALLATLPGQTRFLTKRALFRIPLLGWSLRAGGFVTIDRENLGNARDSFSEAVASLREGVSVLVFPEGTRSATDELLPFKRGGFLLALKSGLPIVPVAVTGSRAVRRKGSYVIHPGRIQVSYGVPITTEGLGVSKRRELSARVRSEILRLSGRPEASVSDSSAGPRAAERRELPHP